MLSGDFLSVSFNAIGLAFASKTAKRIQKRRGLKAPVVKEFILFEGIVSLN